MAHHDLDNGSVGLASSHGADENASVLSARGLTRHYPVRSAGFRRNDQVVRALDGVDLDLEPGETLGVVGESGCGKSTLARVLALLDVPTAGSLKILDRDAVSLAGSDLRRLRRDVQMIFQDPYTSLNPQMTVGRMLREPFDIHSDVVPRDERDARVAELLSVVGLKPDHANRYAHQFSGGQRQRIGIARALALHPRILICDEAVSALDVSVQGQIINLLQKLQAELGLSYVFIAHDLGVIRHIADRVAVMYLGRVVETGPVDQIYDSPQHPYTQALLSAAPNPDIVAERHQRIVLTGDIPTPLNPPPGCPFHPRCWMREPICETETPPLESRGDDPPSHLSACHFAGSDCGGKGHQHSGPDRRQRANGPGQEPMTDFNPSTAPGPRSAGQRPA